MIENEVHGNSDSQRSLNHSPMWLAICIHERDPQLCLDAQTLGRKVYSSIGSGKVMNRGKFFASVLFTSCVQGRV